MQFLKCLVQSCAFIFDNQLVSVKNYVFVFLVISEGDSKFPLTVKWAMKAGVYINLEISVTAIRREITAECIHLNW